MPLIRIEALPQPAPVDVPALLAAVNEAVAAVLERPPEVAWSTWRTLEPGSYAVGRDCPDEQPRDSHPPLVRIFAVRPPEIVEQIVDVVADVLARELSLAPDNVFVQVERPPA
jgi:phenylpyruvate tautomerase PptA (4-oxalocrotonate tautomerase family)